MVLEIFVLSVLRTGPVHGYELKRRVQRPSLTRLSNNSLYPMLRRFEGEGLVTKTVEAQDGKPNRNIYEITDAGRERLRSQLSSLPPELAGSEEEFLVRVSFFHELPETNRRAIVVARESALIAARAQVSELLTEIVPSEKTEWRTTVMDRVLDGIEGERAWIAQLTSGALVK
jgi:DNA-binding PadR family transcriptional regulator